MPSQKGCSSCVLADGESQEGGGTFEQCNREKWLNCRCEGDYETCCSSGFLVRFLFGLLALLLLIMLHVTYRAKLKRCKSHQVTGHSVLWAGDTQPCCTQVSFCKKSLETQIRCHGQFGSMLI